ncbi:hypothetical protein DL93DRAFT_2057493 [Clavulina sp. PMI_390]|nr:hypothetical protein DL93DRAFT_2057493 [Clavulina sp. PMI_390]
MLPRLLSVLSWSFLVLFVRSAPSISQIDNLTLDSSGIFFISYDGVVNANSFQQNAVITYDGYEYAGWYTSTGYAILARRSLTSTSWSTLQLPHQLSTSDSHNVISIGISPADGVIHVALDMHSTVLYYTASESGLATNPTRTWVASRFGTITNTLGTLSVGSQITYPQWLVTPDNKLQFVYRTGVSGNGAGQLAEYSSGTWTNVGSWASASGSYTADTGAVSTARNLYIHGFTYDKNGRLHVSGTWRETNAAVSCSSSGLTNHDTVYFYSDDRGRTWYNNAKTQVGTAGSNPINVNTAGIIVDSLDANHALMNQESQTSDSTGQPHIIISYVPGRFTQCVSSYETGRVEYGRAFHLYRNSTNLWTKFEIPLDLDSVGRSQIVLDSSDNAFVFFPYGRVMSASKSTSWTDWTEVFTGSGMNIFGEIAIDRSRALSSSIVGILYQKNSTGTTPSAVGVSHFTLG